VSFIIFPTIYILTLLPLDSLRLFIINYTLTFCIKAKKLTHEIMSQLSVYFLQQY